MDDELIKNTCVVLKCHTWTAREHCFHEICSSGVHPEMARIGRAKWLIRANSEAGESIGALGLPIGFGGPG
jgi:hypothetical protein